MDKDRDNLITFRVCVYVYNGNGTEWTAMWSEIIRVISKLHKHAPRVRFEITSMISDQNCKTKFNYHFIYSHFETAEFSQYQYFIDQEGG